jgi:hypothetical protein
VSSRFKVSQVNSSSQVALKPATKISLLQDKLPSSKKLSKIPTENNFQIQKSQLPMLFKPNQPMDVQ